MADEACNLIGWLDAIFARDLPEREIMYAALDPRTFFSRSQPFSIPHQAHTHFPFPITPSSTTSLSHQADAMPPALHPRSAATTSLFTGTLLVSFAVVALPHLFPCPFLIPRYPGSNEHRTISQLPDDAHIKRQEFRQMASDRSISV